MSAVLLDRSTAFSSGSDLWILTDPEASSWTCTVDWYLNFSIMRAKNHKMTPQSDRLVEILAACELEFSIQSVGDGSPIMIDSHRRLPNTWTVVVPITERPESWLNIGYHIWNQLKRPSLRVFVPDPFSEEMMLKNWGQLSLKQTVTLVPAQAN